MYFFEGHPNLDSLFKHSPLENAKISSGPSTNVVKLGIVYRSISTYCSLIIYIARSHLNRFQIQPIHFSATVLGVPEVPPN